VLKNLLKVKQGRIQITNLSVVVVTTLKASMVEVLKAPNRVIEALKATKADL
jgi:hypothetical protein